MVIRVLDDDMLFETTHTRKIHSVRTSGEVALTTFKDSRIKVSQEYIQEMVDSDLLSK